MHITVGIRGSIKVTEFVVVLLRFSKYSLVLWLRIDLSIPRHRLSYIYTYYYTLLLYDHCCECVPQNSCLDHNTFLFRTSIERDITSHHPYKEALP